MPAAGGETVVLDEAGTEFFGEITYNAAGTYEYKITESSAWGTGWSVSPTEIKATVTVTDNKDGTLGAEVSYDPDKTFTNKYSAEGEIELEAEKIFTGREWTENDKFEFTLAVDGEVPEGVTLPETCTGIATMDEPVVTFDPIKFTKTGEFTFTITETKGNLPAVEYDTEPKKITVKVTDNGDGTLDAKVTSGEAKVTATNVYVAEGTTVLEVEKALAAGSIWPEGKTAEFTLSAVTEGAPMPEKGEEKVVIRSVGKAVFGAITWSEEDVGKTYTYKIEETSDWGAGWTKSDPITVTVKVTDNGEGKYEAEVKYSPDSAKITNTYTEKKTSLTVIKKFFDGNEKHTLESIEVTLYRIVNGKEEPIEKVILSPDNNWRATFDGLPIKDEDGNPIKYQVRETKGGEGYTVSYSPSNVAQYNGDKLRDITITNTKEQRIPKTSDDFNAFFWGGTMLVSIVTGCWAAITLHRYE